MATDTITFATEQEGKGTGRRGVLRLQCLRDQWIQKEAKFEKEMLLAGFGHAELGVSEEHR